jgi:DnaK suppressor protein
VASAVREDTELLHQRLEEQFEVYSERLTHMIIRSGADGARPAIDEVSAPAEPSRQTLADIAHALRRMAEGRYGDCERCGEAIPLAQLEITPHARYCASCRSRAQEVRRARSA